MRTLLACALVLAAYCGARAEDKIDAKKLVGKWETKDKDVIEFTKDGKMTLTAKSGDKELKYEGTYKVDGNKLSATIKVDDRERTQKRTIAKLTDAELMTKGEEGEEETFVRIKDKK